MEKSKAEHNMRLFEAETAMASGIPFDRAWYVIPVQSRAQMIAARLGRTMINNLIQTEANYKVK